MPEMSFAFELAGMKEWFASFCRSYREADPAHQANLELKEVHTSHVCDAARLIAQGGGERRLFLAQVAALCHDLGRFPQYRRYRTFRDSESINHAHLSAQILAQSNLLDPLHPGERDSIMCAVRLHNAFTIPPGLAPEAEDLLKVVRDADKVDIWRVFIEYYAASDADKASAVALGFPDLPSCSPQVFRSLAAGKMVSLDTVHTLNDYKLLQLSWVYDINFSAALVLIREREIVQRVAATLPQKDEVLQAVAAVQRYLEGRLAGSVAAQ